MKRYFQLLALILFNLSLFALPGLGAGRIAYGQEVKGIPGFPCYRTVEETYAAAEQLATNNPHLATWVDIGNSWKKEQQENLGYDVMVLQLGNRTASKSRPLLFVVAAMHGREYVTAELATRFAEYLVEQYTVSPEVTWLLDYHQIDLVLIANPDGRKFAEQGLPWRKNANNTFCPNSSSRGVDINRNFSFQWSVGDGMQCSETFAGPIAASEPETQAIEQYLRTRFPAIREDPLTTPAPTTTAGLVLDLHSYSELVLWPWSFANQQAPNHAALQTLGRKLAFFNGYIPQPSAMLYPANGTTIDFTYGALGVASYIIELGTTFFEPCKQFEQSILPDNLSVLLYAAKVAAAPYLLPGGPDVTEITMTPSTIGLVSPGQSTLVSITATIDDTQYRTINGKEASQRIAAAEYFLAAPPWITPSPTSFPMNALDGSFDQSREVVGGSIPFNQLQALGIGRHLIFVRGKDADGNWGPVSATFLDLLENAPAKEETYVPVVKK